MNLVSCNKQGFSASLLTSINNSLINKTTLLLILSVILSTSTLVLAEDYFEIRVDPLGNVIHISYISVHT